MIFVKYTIHFLKTGCSKYPLSAVMKSWRCSVKSCITHVMNCFSDTGLLFIQSGRLCLKYVPLRITPQSTFCGVGGSLRNQEILVASLNRKTMRLDMEAFCAASPYSYVQYVMWHHLAGTTLSHVCLHPSAHALCLCLWPWKSLLSPHCCILLIIEMSVFSAGLCSWLLE